MAGLGITSCPLRGQVDPRALRFTAAATAGVLAVVLLTIDAVRPLALGLLASQVAMYGFTAFVSMHWSVWAQLFARIIWPDSGHQPRWRTLAPHASLSSSASCSPSWHWSP